MKNYKLYFAIFLSLLFFTTQTFADVKIKSRQTTSGQTFENTTYIKGKRQRTEQNMSGMQMINLTQCDLKRGVQMNSMTKTYVIDLFNQTSENNTQNASTTKDNVVRAGGTITSTVTYKDTGEIRKMFGYNAKHIITTMETVSSPDACSPMDSKMEIDGWYIDAAFALDCETDRYAGGYKPQSKQGCQDKYQLKTIGSGKRGYPVYEKMTMFDKSGKEMMSTVNEVIELSQATLDQALFEIPSDYREVKDAGEMYKVTANGSSSTMPTMPNTSGANSDIQKQAQKNMNDNSSDVGEKQPGVVRIGIITKTGAVGDGINAADLAAAVNNTLGEYLKGTKIELVPLEAKLASLVDGEAKQKGCDYVLSANVSHKKGGGGFGGFGKALGAAVAQTGGGNWGNTTANVAGAVAANTIVAATVSQNVKSKDEITLEVKLQKSGGAPILTQQFKAKAKSDGDDIISKVVEQTAQAIIGKTE